MYSYDLENAIVHFFILFYVFKKREGAHTCAGEEGRGREGILSRLHTHCGAQCKAQSHDPEIVTRAEVKSWTLN